MQKFMLVSKCFLIVYKAIYKMKFKIYLVAASYLFSYAAFADNNVAASTSYAPKQIESQVLSQYLGLPGTAPKHDTVSAAGAAFENTPSGTNVYGFYTQTLSNDIYYEFRLYGRENYATTNPNIPGVAVGDLAPSNGYGVTGMLGYAFHTSPTFDITPYVRVNLQQNMAVSFVDTEGDQTNSQTYAVLLGSKFAFKATPTFSPYINLYGGYQNNTLSGTYPSVTVTSPANGTLIQWVTNYEIGLGTKVSEHVTLIPYWIYTTTFNYPDSQASTSLASGGNGQTSLTGTSQLYGLKVSIAW